MKKFNFYVAYLEEMNKLNPFQFKKLINAMANYAETGKNTIKLHNRTEFLFMEIKKVINEEKRIFDISNKRSIAGKKGAEKRWK